MYLEIRRNGPQPSKGSVETQSKHSDNKVQPRGGRMELASKCGGPLLDDRVGGKAFMRKGFFCLNHEFVSCDKAKVSQMALVEG